MVISARRGERSASHLPPIDFESEGILETKHLQKWILEKPEVLGEDLLVLNEEFRHFETHKDRIDILCLDRKGRLVIVELKRTSHAGYADLQALRYAAMVRSMDLDDAASELSGSNRGKEQGLSVETARDRIISFIREDADGDPTPELESEPRIVLVSQDFSPELLTTAQFLLDHEIDVSCIALNAYRIEEDHYVLVPDKIIPVREVQNVAVKIRKKEEARQLGGGTRAPSRLRYLLESGRIKEGDILLLKHKLPPYVSSRYKENDPAFRATVVVESGAPKLRWERDENLYSPSKLASKVFKEFDPEHQGPPGGANGPDYWGTSNESLSNLAQRVMAGKEP